MSKTLVYGSMDDFTLNQKIYLISDSNDIESFNTTTKTAAQDISYLCKTEDINRIRLYGSKTHTSNLKGQIMKNSMEFKNQNITFMFN